MIGPQVWESCFSLAANRAPRTPSGDIQEESGGGSEGEGAKNPSERYTERNCDERENRQNNPVASQIKR